MCSKDYQRIYKDIRLLILDEVLLVKIIPSNVLEGLPKNIQRYMTADTG
jgi:hypothetical protein